MGNDCPCEAVVALKETVKELRSITEDHEKRLAEGTVNFALIKQDLEYIKGNIDGKQRFNTGIITTVINGAITIILGFIAVKMGLG